MIDEKRISSEQEQAIELCTDMTEKFVGVTGSAGTGKTFVLGKVYNELKKKVGKDSIVLCAPTGRAAKRIKELTGVDAVTVHRLLQFPQPDDPIEEGEPPPPNLPRRHRDNPLAQKVVLVDESSMLSNELNDFLIDAMPSKGVIRYFGDNQQLAPVEEGGSNGIPPPFVGILANEPSVRLTYNFRSQDNIISNANLILRGGMPQRNAGFEIIYANSPVETLIEFVTDDFTRMDHQVIMPQRRHASGTMRVNPSIQMRFNPKGDMLRLDRYDRKEPGLAVRGGDKYLWIKNDYNLNMYNGDIGEIDSVDTESGDVNLITTEKPLTVPAFLKFFDRKNEEWRTYDPRKQIELGYAITTHKSQGSEFDTIIYCMMKSNFYLLSRRNFYTAITRAKNRVVLITDRAAIGISLKKKD